MLKSYIKSYLYLLGITLIFTIIISIINYYIPKPFTTIKFLIPIVSIFISSIILGKNIKEKAYLEGIKFSSIYLIITSILKLILKVSFNYKTIIIYIILLLTGTIGSMIGINLKKNKV